MKFVERMQLIKAGYTKKEIAEMEKETASGGDQAGTGTDDRLDLIAQAVAKLTDDFHEMNIRNDASGGGSSEPDIWEKLRNSLAGENPDDGKQEDK